MDGGHHAFGLTELFPTIFLVSLIIVLVLFRPCPAIQKKKEIANMVIPTGIRTTNYR